MGGSSQEGSLPGAPKGTGDPVPPAARGALRPRASRAGPLPLRAPPSRGRILGPARPAPAPSLSERPPSRGRILGPARPGGDSQKKAENSPLRFPGGRVL